MPLRAPFWTAAVVASLALLVVALRQRGSDWTRLAPGKLAFAWTLLLLAAIAGLGGLKQGPIDNEVTAAVDLRNFVPLTVGCAFALGMALAAVRIPTRWRGGKKLAAVGLALMAVSAPAAAWMDVRDHSMLRERGVATHDALESWLHTTGDPQGTLTVIYGLNVPRTSVALRAGDWYIHRYYQSEIDAAFPREGYFYNEANFSDFHSPRPDGRWDLKVVRTSDISPRNAVLTRGTDGSLCNDGQVEVLDIAGGPYYVIHHATPTLGGRTDACAGPPWADESA
jgi:hypothetical protein